MARLPKVQVYEIKWLLHALKSLCEGKNPSSNTGTPPPPLTTGKGGVATPTTSNTNSGASTATAAAAALCSSASLQFDYNVVASVLKTSKYPETGKSIVSGDKESPKSEIKRSRSDLSSVILQQLTAPLEAGKITWAPLSVELTDCSVSTFLCLIFHR